MKFTVVLIAILFAVLLPSAYGEMYTFGKGNDIVGSVTSYTVKDDESLIEIARKFDLGYNEVVAANPDLDPFVPGNGALVQIPAAWVMPDVPVYDGIVINLPEMRLYYFIKQKKSQAVITYPIGIGQEGFDTPLGTFSIIEKKAKPDWHPPASIRKERPELPLVVPHGPENPLGSHALRLSSGTILIHGTHRPWGVGRRVSHGCIRLYPEDIPRLFNAVKNGTRVTIVRQPVKVGIKDEKVYIEIHKDPEDNINYLYEAVKLLGKKNLLKGINTEKLYHAAHEKRGFPVEISD